jgi:hypothetical protein
MKMKRVLGVIVLLLAMSFLAACHPQQEIPPQNWTVANETEFLANCEHCNIMFEKACFGPYLCYYYSRKIGNAYVELDQISYTFDNETRQFIDKKVHWRDDLPSTLPPVISEEEALSIGGGTKAILVYIDPESSVFADVKPTPTNPCWAVSIYKTEIIDNETFTYNCDVVVVDAVTGKILGHGIPVP